ISFIASDFTYLPDVKVPGKRVFLAFVDDIKTFEYTCLGDVYRFMDL
ncbi:unnamed protein product, partial [Brassica rapa subsp. trilocularis]